MGGKRKQSPPPATPSSSSSSSSSPRTYAIHTKPAFDRSFDKLTKKNKTLADKIVKAVDALETNPRPNGYKKLNGVTEGGEAVHRIEVAADYRILYVIRDAQLMVLLVDVGDRKEVYK